MVGKVPFLAVNRIDDRFQLGANLPASRIDLVGRELALFQFVRGDMVHSPIVVKLVRLVPRETFDAAVAF